MLKEDILQLLKAGKDTYLSGQRISAQLGVSRAAVWKAVEALRKDGYGIDSRSNCGYRLVRVPDVMTQEEMCIRDSQWAWSSGYLAGQLKV